MNDNELACIFNVGSINVRKISDRGNPTIIFIPGMAVGSWIWDDIVPSFLKSHTVYQLTLPGFDGMPSITGPLFDTITSDIAELINLQSLDKPTLIGHSLGGFLSFQVASEYPDIIGNVIAVDGYPVFPNLAYASECERRDTSEYFVNLLVRGKNKEEFVEAMTQFMIRGTNDSVKATEIGRRTANSDPKAIEQYIHEMLNTDLQPQLYRIMAPVLLLVATHSYMRGVDEDEQQKYFDRMLKSIVNARVKLIKGSRHFMMVDQPLELIESIKSFI